MIILLLPIAGIGILRLYESELIRRTESELIAQGAIVTASYALELQRRMQLGNDNDTDSCQLSRYAAVPAPDPSENRTEHGQLRPIFPKLELAKELIRPPAPVPEPAVNPPDPCAKAAAEHLVRLLIEASEVTLAGIRVTDHQGVVVACSQGILGEVLMDREEVARALKGENVSLLRDRGISGPSPPLESISRGSRLRVHVAMPVVVRGRILGAVLLSRTPLEITRALYIDRYYLLAGAAALLGVVVVVSILTSFSISRPLRALVHQAELVSEGKKGAAVPLKRPGTYEVDQLSNALANMAVTLEKQVHYISMFASNVSHEFKTPLTSIRGTVELLRDHIEQMDPAERNRFLDILDKDADRLERLLTRLLELARAEVLRPGAEESQVEAMLKSLSEKYRSSGVFVEVSCDPDIGRVNASPEVLESIVSNLINNSVQHGGEGVRVRIKCDQQKLEDGELVELVVSDDGPGVSPANASKLFTPFFTTARAAGGTGLGLAIVKALVEVHNGKIWLEPTSSGAEFHVCLPTKQT